MKSKTSTLCHYYRRERGPKLLGFEIGIEIEIEHEIEIEIDLNLDPDLNLKKTRRTYK